MLHLRKWVLLIGFFCLLSHSYLQARSNFLDLNDLIQETQPLIADYVIVGVGTSGAVLAKQLTDDHQTSVIALHNGKNLTQDPEIKYSRNAVTTVASALLGPPFFQSGETTPQPFADGRELLWAIARPEGGASSVNAGTYDRGTAELYAQWEAIAGSTYWSVSRIFAIYKELERYNGLTPNPIFRGYFGPVNIRQVLTPSPASVKFSQAVHAAIGVPFLLDYNDPTTPIGTSPLVQYTQKGVNGRLRVSSATAFLNKDVMTPNGRGIDGRLLRVLFKSKALRIIWQGNRAIGVEFIQKGKCKKVFANKGVIVCAGLYSSAFLMHSGVGPRAVLESLDIPVLFDNPNVGQGLVDQPQVALLFSINPEDISLKNINSPFGQISWLPLPDNPTVRKFRFATTTDAIPGTALALFDLPQPQSRGRIVINSPDPLDPPVIDIGVFSNPADLALYQFGLQVYIKAINAALQSIDPEYQLLVPDPAILDNPQLVTKFIKEQVASNQTFQSHCRMAPFNQGGVVDSTGHVYGVQNLIVADDSIVPLCTDGAPMATAYLIAANIAQILLNP